MGKIAILGFDDWFYIANLLSLMKSESKRIKLIAPKNHAIAPLITKGYEILTFEGYYPGKIDRILPCIISLIRILKREKFDLIHIPSSRPFWFFIIFLFIKLYLRSDLAITMHEPYRREGDASTGQKYNYPEVFCETHLSNYMFFGGKSMLNEFKIRKQTPAKLVECSLGVFSYLNEIYREKKPRKLNQILFFGRIEKYKGLHVLIESLKYVNRDFKLIIAGRGHIARTPLLSSLVKQNKVQIFNEYIADNFLYELVSTSGIVAVPYLTGTQSAVISDSFAFNTPVIVTRVGSIHEIVKDGVTGYIIEPNNPKQLAERLDLLLANQDLQKKMQENIELENNRINTRITKILSKIYFMQ